MSDSGLYAFAGIGLCLLGWFALLMHRHLLRKLLAINVLGSGVFLLLVALAEGRQGDDPVPQALVITGIVVAVAATALALVLLRRLHALTGQTDADTPASGTWPKSSSRRF